MKPSVSRVYMAVVGFTCGVVLMLLVGSTSSSVIARWPQPTTVAYQSFDPYTLFVVERRPRNPLREVVHEIRIMRGDDAQGYGYMISAALGVDAAAIKAAGVSWTTEGVELDVPDGPRLFFAKHLFIGGR